LTQPRSRPAETGRPPADAAGTTGQVCGWLASLTLDDVPHEVAERAKHLTLDGLGCALVGARLPWSERAVAVVTSLEGQGRGTLIGRASKTTPSAAALLNGTFIQGFELDDYHPLGPLHSASVVIPAALAAAEQSDSGISGRTLLVALIAGYELGPRVGIALHGGDMISRGWHSGSVFGTHAAAAAAGIVYGLDAAGFEDALGLAATQSSGLMAAQYEAMCKRMHHGFSARAGLYGAALAAGDFTGIKRVFEREYGGFLSTFGIGGRPPDPDAITDQLGSAWEIERISVKPYAAQGGTHAAIDAVFAIQGERPFRADDIERIDVYTGHTVFHHGVWELRKPLTETGAQMSLAYGIAAAILDGAVMVEQFSPARITRSDVWDLLPRIHAHHDPAIDRMGPEARLRTRLKITFTDDSAHEVTVPSPKGGLHRPLANTEIREKFRALTAGLMSAERRAALEAAVLGMEHLPAVGALAELLYPAVGQALTLPAECVWAGLDGELCSMLHSTRNLSNGEEAATAWGRRSRRRSSVGRAPRGNRLTLATSSMRTWTA
jgi:aconitate decarboxylase